MIIEKQEFNNKLSCAMSNIRELAYDTSHFEIAKNLNYIELDNFQQDLCRIQKKCSLIIENLQEQFDYVSKHLKQ